MRVSTYAAANMKKVILATCLLVAFAGCRNYEPIPVAPSLDLDRFMGQWYVIASIQTLVDRDPYNAVEIYERAERGISITYQFNAGAPDGDLKTYKIKAMVDNPGINTDWQVTYFTWPFESDYRFLHVEPDYSVVVIGQPSRKYCWILSRQKTIPDALYSDIVLYLQQLGYDVAKIRRIPQM